ncbi:MAG TPA: 1,4-alpha-glucan branching protein domain-containing protein [Gemmatimonadales bacterium]
MDFVLALHSHLPWVLHHGRWPHGSDWLCEAAVDTYLPLIAALKALEHREIPSPVTLGVTPILANQLAHPAFVAELEVFLAQRIEACDEAVTSFERSGETHLRPLALFWRGHLRRLDRTFARLGHDPVGTLRRLADAGRIELMSSAATHAFLPLLARDESIRFQLELGRREHARLFGHAPSGCWLPECAYRNAGPWRPSPNAPAVEHRVGLEDLLSAAGYRYCFTDAHLAQAGQSLSLYGERDVVDGIREPGAALIDAVFPRSPYRTYEMAPSRGEPVAVLVRDPQSSLRVWSRWQGYPGDAAYLEFHKIRYPGGLKFWRVTGLNVDLGGKEPYDPNVARARAWRHAHGLAAVLREVSAASMPLGGDVIAVPFDTELFGHWWFEGVDFLADLYRALAQENGVRPATASEHLDRAPPAQGIRLAEGSWGANGDYSMWLNPGTTWTWERLWPLEHRFWRAAPQARGTPLAEPVLTQAARELVLAQASDWQFIISTGAATDYAERRFAEHCDNLAELLDALEAGSTERLLVGAARVDALSAVNDPFPTIREALDAVLDQA